MHSTSGRVAPDSANMAATFLSVASSCSRFIMPLSSYVSFIYCISALSVLCCR
nr:MAG TPA: hypothetical protein [Bacteriophage sp.]